MMRREFIAGLGGAAAWPLAANAQQAGKLRTIGYLGANSEAALIFIFAKRWRTGRGIRSW